MARTATSTLAADHSDDFAPVTGADRTTTGGEAAGSRRTAGAADAAAEDGARRSQRYQIRIRGLCRSFGSQQVLSGVDLDIERGRINIIIGGSGQGKSVLLKHVIGLLRPDAGQVYVDGVDLTTLSEVELGEQRRKFGMVFQYAALFDSLTVEDNVAFPLVEHTRRRWGEIRKQVRDKLHALGLHDVEHKYPAELSGGMRKRVGLARALVLEPEILLYDEPTTGLDPIQTQNVDEMIRDTARRFGVTSVVISHDIASTFRIGDRVAMLHQGKIVCQGPPTEVLRSQHPELRRFLAMSGVALGGDAGGDAGGGAGRGPGGGQGAGADGASAGRAGTGGAGAGGAR